MFKTVSQKQSFYMLYLMAEYMAILKFFFLNLGTWNEDHIVLMLIHVI